MISAITILTILTILTMTSLCSPSILRLPTTCSHQNPDLTTSTWKDLLESGRFSPSRDPRNLHLLSLRMSLLELVQVIQTNKARFALDEFGESFTDLDQTFATFSYESLVPSGSLDPASDWDNQVVAAYTIFQRLSMGLEVVRGDMEHQPHTSQGTRRMWRRVIRIVRGILGNLYTELVAGDRVTPPLPLTRAVIPHTIRCLGDSVSRDVRDFIILRQTLQVTAFFTGKL